MTLDDLTPRERRITFLFELACFLLEQAEQLPPTEQEKEGACHDD